MSVIWKIDLFVKPTIEKPDEAWCKVCEKFLKLSDRSPRNLEYYISLIDDPFLDDMKVKILELIMEKFNVEDKKYFFPFWA